MDAQAVTSSRAEIQFCIEDTAQSAKNAQLGRVALGGSTTNATFLPALIWHSSIFLAGFEPVDLISAGKFLLRFAVDTERIPDLTFSHHQRSKLLSSYGALCEDSMSE